MSNEEIVSHIKYLRNADILSGNEIKMCEIMLEQIEVTDKIDLGEVIKSLATENDAVEEYENIGSYDRLELVGKIDELIRDRKNKIQQDLLNLSSKETNFNSISKKVAKHFFDKYVDVIDIKEDNTYIQLENLEDKRIDISTGIKFLDEEIYGLKNGTITTILGDIKLHKSIWAINIAYKAITENKNVLYLTPSDTIETIYKRFLTRHSCDVNKFKNRFRFNSSHIDYDKDNYNMIYTDFKMNYLDRLIVFDESEFLISTHHNLQKLFTYAENKFLETTGEGISLIVIDDFTGMKLDNGKKSITNQNTIIYEYYKYLRSQSRNFLGTERKIHILMTLCENYLGGLGTKYVIPKDVKILSDNAFGIYDCEDTKYKEGNIFHINILQTSNGISYEYDKSVSADYEYWYIRYDDEIEENLISKLEKAKKENEQLRNDLDFAKEEINNSSIETNQKMNQDLKTQLDELSL